MTLDLVFPAAGSDLPTDHAYPLYAALSEVVHRFHDDDSPLRFAPITGVPSAKASSTTYPKVSGKREGTT